ncbi:MAG: hypothetical protein A2252_09240 [Elusimicrobia bacterium RIFOXYA2_FULL_39_19]|nr:MAG: hypothetical protein A2252_09240 [Elusimicrobia bacterium RIFOXYA2_FULL_39_19]
MINYQNVEDAKVVNYEDYDITFNENSETWAVRLGPELLYANASFKSVKNYIDRFEKNKRKFERIKILVLNEWGSWVKDTEKYTQGWLEGEITSITEEGDVWKCYKDVDGKTERRKYDHEWLNKHGFYELNDKNKEIANEIMRLKKEADSLNKKAEELEKQLATIRLKKNKKEVK